MRIVLKNTLRSLNESMGAINALALTWNVVSGCINWYHNGQLHHKVKLNEEQQRHHVNGGAFECQYACGTVLRTS
jgi:hypothetical protein